MKKITVLFALLLSSLSLVAQIPNYYSDVDIFLLGQDLKNELAVKVTSTQTTNLSYTPGVWNALQQADVDPENSNNVVLIYGYDDTDGVLQTDRTRGINANGGGATEWNREHVYPKSLGNPNLGTTGAGSDAHHLRPADPAMNAARSNRKFADGSGNAGITSQGYFYPGDEWKGDVARMMLFMYLRYDDRCLPSVVGVGNTVASDSNMIDLFLEWNVEDPVSDFESTRNAVIEGIQGNRNPFIDNPAFATTIWGGPQAEDRFGNAPSTGELFLSEYVEGSSYNKAIEIANFSGNSIDLSDYNLRKQTNGAGNWSSGYALSGLLVTQEVFVVANSQANNAVLSRADVSTTNSTLNFNGNDAIGLFKNGVLIDIIGNFNGGSANFAKDVTLRRKPTVSSGNTTYNSVEWDTFPRDTFSDLGNHTVSGSSVPLVYCNSKGNNVNFEFIDFVGLGSISNSTSANGGYGNFTSQVGEIQYGSNTIFLSAGFSGQAYTEYFGVWIDFNQNGTFESSEKVVTGSTSSSAILSNTITVPSTAQAGETRMRVAMKWNSNPDPCETFAYGEVEDYTVNILSSSGKAFLKNNLETKAEAELQNDQSIFNISLESNIDITQIVMADDRLVSYNLYNMLGQEVAKGTFKERMILPSLAGGVYIIQVSDGQRTLQKRFIKD